MAHPKYKYNRSVGIHPEPAPKILYTGLVDLQFWTWDNLSAPYWRLYWSDRSGARIKANGKQWNLTPSSLILIPPNFAFSTYTSRRLNHLHIQFTLEKNISIPNATPLTRKIKPFELSLIKQLCLSLKKKTATSQCQASQLSHMLVQLSLPLVESHKSKSGEIDPRIDKTIQYLHSRLPESTDNPQMAALAGLSLRSFIRLFSKTTGESPKQYQLRQRVEYSCRLMNDINLTLDDISTRCGFYDRFHYSKAFRALLKISPAAFRRKCIMYG